MKELKVTLTFTEEVLGTASSDPELHEEFIASKAPDAPSREQEVAALGTDAVVEKSKTIFPKDENGNPFFWDYQIKGFFKDTCGMLRKIDGTLSSKVKAYKKEIDGVIFINERMIFPELKGEIGSCQRPLRASTPQGDRVALANSETIPKGSKITFTVRCLIDSEIELVKEWLDYGIYRGIGQWRNSGKGRFIWDEVEE